jgi:hypothetical protein
MGEPRTCDASTVTADLTGGAETDAHDTLAAYIAEWCSDAVNTHEYDTPAVDFAE